MRWKYLSHTIRKYSQDNNGFHVGIVGAGPAGFYCAQQLLKVIDRPELVKMIFENNQL